MTTNPTPSPWFQAGWLIVGRDGISIAEMLGDNTEANIQLIITAVNSHADLLEACEEMVAMLLNPSGISAGFLTQNEANTVKRTQAIIAKAKEKK